MTGLRQREGRGIITNMNTTRYFDEQVLRKRPYIVLDDCRSVMLAPLRHQIQEDGRHRYWGEVILPGENSPRVLRVVTLEDGTTIHNAFLDRNFRRDP